MTTIVVADLNSEAGLELVKATVASLVGGFFNHAYTSHMLKISSLPEGRNEGEGSLHP